MQFLDKYINPIHLLGLRSYLRTKRFLYTFNITILLMVSAMLLGFFFMSIEDMSPSDMGKNLFTIFSIIQYIIISLIFPAFSCTAIISEREGKTYDLLVTANLSSSDIVWGKFLSAFTHSALFLISSLPIVTMAFLFGGITPVLIVSTYVVLFAYAALVVMICLSISSLYKTINRAIIASYLVIIAFNSFLFPTLIYLLFDYLHYSELSRFLISIGGNGNLNVFLTVYIVPPFVFCSLIFAPYLVAKNSLRTYANNKSTALKLYFFIFGTSLLAIFLAYYINSAFTLINAPLAYDMIIVLNGVCLAITGFLCVLGAMGFAAENPTPDKFVIKRLQEYLKAGTLRRIFASKFGLQILGPGSYRGAIFVNAACIFWMAIYITATVFLINHFSLESNKIYGENYLQYTVIPALVILSFIYFFSMFAVFLSFRIQQAGFRRAVLFCFVLFVSILLPLYALFYTEASNFFRASLFNFQYLSPTMCFGWSLQPLSELQGSRYSYFIYNIPIHYWHIGFYFIMGFILQISNHVRSRRTWKNLQESEETILQTSQEKPQSTP